MKELKETRATQAIRSRYDRLAPLYEVVEGLAERRVRDWRELMWSKVEGVHILEVGVGTGRNLSFYPEEVQVTAFDFSDKMLRRAREKAAQQKMAIHLLLMDAQNLGFRDSTFDTAVASLVFCSVPDPVRGLTEIKRVVKPGGKVLLLEHVLSASRPAAWVMNQANPLMLKLFGDNINRKTVENVAKSGLIVEKVTDLSGIFKLIEARK